MRALSNSSQSGIMNDQINNPNPKWESNPDTQTTSHNNLDNCDHGGIRTPGFTILQIVPLDHSST